MPEHIHMNAEPGSFGADFAEALLSTRVNAAMPYLTGAARFSRLVGQIETTNATNEFGEFWEEMKDHATACVFFADAAIESYSNELFSDAKKIFPSEFIAGLNVMWPEFERKKRPIDKLNFALSLRSKPPLDRKASILKAVNALGRLRNELTHFKPEWSHDLKKHKTVSEELNGHFLPNAWMKSEQLFPRAWVGHSATVWAVQTSVGFLRDFEEFADLSGRTNWKAFEARLIP